MNRQSSDPGVLLATESAGVRLFACMSQDVALQMALGDEALSTVRIIAGERAFPGLFVITGSRIREFECESSSCPTP